jgi:Family of unknown function (DUF6338)
MPVVPPEVMPQAIEILFLLLPGFIAAWLFYSLTGHKKPSSFERIVQALIFTAVIRVFVFLLSLSGFPINRWGDEAQFSISVGLGVLVGILFTLGSNYNSFHAVMQFFRVTKKDSTPAWYHNLFKYERFLVLTLRGGDRIQGWARHWPEDHDDGHFALENARWLDKDDDHVNIDNVVNTIIPAKKVLFVQICEKTRSEKEQNFSSENKLWRAVFIAFLFGYIFCKFMEQIP